MLAAQSRGMEAAPIGENLRSRLAAVRRLRRALYAECRLDWKASCSLTSNLLRSL